MPVAHVSADAAASPAAAPQSAASWKPARAASAATSAAGPPFASTCPALRARSCLGVPSTWASTLPLTKKAARAAAPLQPAARQVASATTNAVAAPRQERARMSRADRAPAPASASATLGVISLGLRRRQAECGADSLAQGVGTPNLGRR